MAWSLNLYDQGMPSIDDVIASFPPAASVSIWCGPLDGPATYSYREDVDYYAASTIKVALVLAALRQAEAGRIDLDAAVPVHNSFASRKDGGPFAMDPTEDGDPEVWKLLGETASLRWLCRRSIVRSSNLATNLVFEQVGPESIAEALQASGTQQMLMSRGIEDAVAREAGLTNSVTAADLARLMQAIGTGRAASADSTAELLDMLGAQEFNERIPAGLPAGTKIEHKTGSITAICHDFGIIHPAGAEPYVLAICTADAGTEEEASGLIADVTRALWEARP